MELLAQPWTLNAQLERTDQRSAEYQRTEVPVKRKARGEAQ